MTERTHAPLAWLLGCASHRVPGPEATPAIWEERTRLHDVYGRGWVYEVVARAGESLEDLVGREASRLVFYASTRRVWPVGPPEITIALFVDATLYFVPSAAFMFAFVACQGLDASALGAFVRSSEMGVLE